MKVICINNTIVNTEYIGYPRLIIGKEYDAEDTSPLSCEYRIRNEGKFVGTFMKICFLTRDEYRDKRLKEIGI